MIALLLLAAVSQSPPAPPPAAPAPSRCLFTRVGKTWEGGCGPLFGQGVALTLTAAKAITTGTWSKDLRPASVWIVEPKSATSEDPASQPIEVEIEAGGKGVLRGPDGWYPISGFLLARDTLTFEVDAAHPVPPNGLDRDIVWRAAAILSSEAVWDRADDRVCKPDDRTWSIYCALQRATVEVTGGFHHRRPALEVVRAIVDERTAGRSYEHRLKDYNNDPSTRLEDVRSLFAEALARIEKTIPQPTGRLELLTIDPAAGSTVTGNSTIIATLEYAIDGFEAGQYFVEVSLATHEPGVFKPIALPSVPPNQWVLKKAAGTLKVNQPLRVLWKDPQIPHPIRLYFDLNKRDDRHTSILVASVGPIEFKE